MNKALFLTVLVVFAAGSAGCTLFRKSDRAKESSAIARDVEETFRRRWVEKRAAEIVAQGSAADPARVQAENEFREQYPFANSAKK
jgi:hypothetical protein